MDKIKVMIVDDHPIVREGLRELLETNEEIEVIAEAEDGYECLRLMNEVRPDIVFMDIKLPGINGIETTRLLYDKYPQVKIIILTIYDDDQYVTEAIQSGAKGYILKNVKKDELMKIIYSVMSGQAYLDPSVTANVLLRLQNGKKGPHVSDKTKLTQREFEILKGIVAGQTDREIANSLIISDYTVRSHIKNIFRKLKVTSRTNAVTKAVHEKIINIP